MKTQIFKPHQAFYESFFENTFDGLAYCQMLFDTQRKPVDFRYIEVNKNFETLTGLKNVAGKKVTDVIPGITTSNPELLEIYGRVSMTRKSEKFETYVSPLAKWFLISVYSPKKGFFVAAFQNITDRVRIEKDLENAKVAARNVLEDLQIEQKKLAEINAKDEAILASIGNGLVVTDLNRNITFINISGEQILGWKAKNLLGKNWSSVVKPMDDRGQEIPLDIFPSKKPLTSAISVNYLRKDGTSFPVSLTVSPIVIEGNFIGFVEVFRDITEEKRIDRAKTEFVSLASHQLRTPLSSIRWYSEMLLTGYADTLKGKEKKYVIEINHSNLRMIELVNALLNVSQLEMGMPEIKTENVDVGGLIRDVVHDVVSRTKNHDVHLTVKTPDTLPSATIDQRLTRILIQNLVVNAIKYTPPRGSVEIESIEVKKGGAFNGHRADSTSIGLRVSDTGIGIPNSQKDRIFTKLFRADNARTFDTDGTGLGLYLAKCAVEYCKGDLWFISTEGKGSTFFALLPLRVAESPVLSDKVLAHTPSG